MENLNELLKNLESFRKTGGVNNTSYRSLATSLKKLQTELESTEKEASLQKSNSAKLLKEKLTLEQEKKVLSVQLENLSKEKLSLESQVSKLQKTRLSLSPVNLVSSFRTSLDEMDKGLKKTSSGIKYHVSNMNVSLKTNLALEGEELRFQMPKADDAILPETLSTIEFSLKASTQDSEMNSYREVPDLLGLSQEGAETKLLDAGLRLGEVRQKESSALEGTVIAQLPSGNSFAELGAAVDLVISGAPQVDVPQLVGLEFESAKQAIENAGLLSGEITEQNSKEKKGIVLTQNPRTGLKVNAGSSINLVVSTDTLNVPNLLGLELESAKKVIEKSLLQLAGIIEEPSKEKAGIIIAQSLKPETKNKVNSKITLTVSTEIKKETSERTVSEKNPKLSSKNTVKVASRTPVKSSIKTVSKMSKKK